MRTATPVLCLFLFLAACAPEGDLSQSAALPPLAPPYAIDATALPEPQRTWFADGAADWNAQTGRDLFHLDPSGPHRVVLGGVPANGTEGVFRYPSGIEIHFDTPLAATIGCFLPIALHALGHVADSTWPANPADPHHSANAADVMFPAITCNKTVTAADAGSIP